MKILIAEDELQILKIVAKRLKEEGFIVDTAKDGKICLYLIKAYEYDCIVLDIMLPVIDGISILKSLRAKKINTPVLLLTAKNSISDKVKGLDMGADDYLTKPFSLDELVARVRALLRRESQKIVNELKIADLSLDLITREVRRNGKLISLTSKEYALLEYLLKNKERTLTKTQIAENIWNYDFEYDSNIVEVYIKYLRRKIDENFKEKLIHNIRGIGYVLKVKK
ncbi:MAG: response regulator transcription factor [Actinobacteria bacterium]|nr:response regulator transcription factor [Actinomycetota bacterium]